MAANNLFPPIIDDYLPAFLQADNSCKIVFRLPQFNVASDFKLDLTQLTVSNLNTNKSMLYTTISKDRVYYPNEIKITPATLNKEDGTYSVVLSGEDLKTEAFDINTYYKIQIRFTGGGAADYDKKNEAEWLNKNLEHFSEWSTVGLIRAIAQPILNIQGLDGTVLTYPSITGNLSFEDTSETESIYCYRIVLQKDDIIIEDSNFIYPEPTREREINYTFKSNVAAEGYIANFYLVTKNGYSMEAHYPIKLKKSPTGDTGIEVLSVEPDMENGLMKILLNTTNVIEKNNKIILKRASSLDGFNFWHDVMTYQLNEGLAANTNFVYLDLSIQSGIWYQYGIQIESSTGIRTEIIIKKDESGKNESFITIFDNMFLVAGGQQLKIKFNPTISTYKRNIQESQTTTLGSKFPFIRRNGSMDYYQINISGMISAISDEDEIQIMVNDSAKSPSLENISRGRLFGSKDFIYNGQTELYEKYNAENNIGKYNDIIYEKMFRDKVIDFLYKDNVKLFKSTPEGNKLVKIMNVNLTPETGLGRYIYSFSCDAVEIADPTTENIVENNIQAVLIEVGENINV